MRITSTLLMNDNKKGAAQKAGGGSSSGLGEFWNTELAKNPALSLPARVALGPTEPNRFGGKPKSFLSSSEASEVVDISSSKDMWNTPSLGVRRWWRRVRDGVESAG